MLHLNSSVVMVHFWKDISWSAMYLRQCHIYCLVFFTADGWMSMCHPTLTALFSGELKMNLGKTLSNRNLFLYLLRSWDLFPLNDVCRGFPKVKRLDKVQGRSNNSYFFYNLDGWKVIFILQWCFVLHPPPPPLPQFNIVKQKCTYWISEAKPRKKRLNLIWFVFLLQNTLVNNEKY